VWSLVRGNGYELQSRSDGLGAGGRLEFPVKNRCYNWLLALKADREGMGRLRFELRTNRLKADGRRPSLIGMTGARPESFKKVSKMPPSQRFLIGAMLRMIDTSMPFPVEGLGMDVDQRDGGQRPLASRVWHACSEDDLAWSRPPCLAS